MKNRIRLISFDKEDYTVFWEQHLKGSFKIFILVAAFFNILIALPIHLLSSGKEIIIYNDIRCNMFTLCTGFAMLLTAIDLLSGYWSVINDIKGNNWGISVFTFLSFGIAYNYFVDVCTWNETAIGYSVLVSLCVTCIAIKCCKK